MTTTDADGLTAAAVQPVVRPGRLKVFLGAAPGVGKTYRMLDEAHRRVARGADVVAGLAECHRRRHTEARLDGLEILPLAGHDYRGGRYAGLDREALLSRRPQVVLIDELAHTNVPGGGRHPKRWQDVEDILAAGIDVVTTLNIQHLESLSDVVEKITGVPQRETVPDEFVRRADEIELVDIPPEGLRRRMAHGNICPPERIDASLAHYFRPGNLIALRELALLWLAGRVDEALHKYRVEHGIGEVWETRERVVVALTGGPEGETLIRRAARIAGRSAGGELLAVHIARSDALAAGVSHAALAAQRALVEDLGGSYHSVVGDEVPTALVDFATAENATQLVLGTSRRRRLERFLTGRGIGETVVALSEDIDVHMVTHERAGHGRLLPSRRRTLPTSRLVAGPVAGVVLPVLLTLALDRMRGTLNLTSEALLFLVAVVGVACIGGVASAVIAALTAALLLNYWFMPPMGEFHVGAAVERARLVEAAAEVEPIKAADRLRTALLRAVSHDLRTPLAGALAAIGSLRAPDVDFSEEDRAELLESAEMSLNRLNRLVENLLDLSRLQAGALSLELRATTPEEVLPPALESLDLPSADTPRIDLQNLETVPALQADPPLLERVLANLVGNAVRHAPGDRPVLVTASALAGRVEVRIADRGPGIAADDRERAFEPFQRLGDRDNTTGLGLGLALARGLTEAMNGTLTPEDTPGGGLTMVLSLPVAKDGLEPGPGGMLSTS
ncbi:Sensor protein KdpD [Streptomyces lavendulae subsp. lavendulae]|uniref:histidine kinase n=1 Tax=Streptomyces lavendulae subsp. lavendulae TaxID=58340 RepID=A0A2K8PBK1_STRLA|nr:ATP-binding protein [Streptomyces lavendulae]ATZ23015.1 Sensor protein KdpD [Streptomyces lavendulae subsp. lavendulae]QUQ52856.1 Adaptive-response sensory-kinase SasA [Streptomyces lavendulae subsp. lavendulae]